MTEIEFADEEMATVRARLGFTPADREVTGADIVVALEARGIVADAEKRWLDGDGPES